MSMFDNASLLRVGDLPSARGAERPELADGDVHLWYCAYEKVDDPELLAAYVALLCEDERARLAALVYAKDRHEYLVTRALMRAVLVRYARAEYMSPAAVRFRRDRYGRPHPANQELASITFNLSHSGGMAACAVSRADAALGVDVEDVERPLETQAMAQRFCSAAELASLNALPDPRMQRRCFFCYWTLKEAYSKALGRGLAVPFDALCFSFAQSSIDDAGFELPTRVKFSGLDSDHASAWHFGLMQASPRHVLAQAIRPARRCRVNIRAAHLIPMQECPAPLPVRSSPLP